MLVSHPKTSISLIQAVCFPFFAAPNFTLNRNSERILRPPERFGALRGASTQYQFGFHTNMSQEQT